MMPADGVVASQDSVGDAREAWPLDGRSRGPSHRAQHQHGGDHKSGGRFCRLLQLLRRADSAGPLHACKSSEHDLLPLGACQPQHGQDRCPHLHGTPASGVSMLRRYNVCYRCPKGLLNNLRTFAILSAAQKANSSLGMCSKRCNILSILSFAGHLRGLPCRPCSQLPSRIQT